MIESCFSYFYDILISILVMSTYSPGQQQQVKGLCVYVCVCGGVD